LPEKFHQRAQLASCFLCLPAFASAPATWQVRFPIGDFTCQVAGAVNVQWSMFNGLWSIGQTGQLVKLVNWSMVNWSIGLWSIGLTFLPIV
jgi:hypothetical protein